jgi:excisionase family DNA binding protein
MTAGPAPLQEALEQALTAALEKVLPRVIEQMATVVGPRAYSVATVAKQLDVSDQTIYRLIDSDVLPVVPHMTPKRIAAGALEAFLAGEHTRPAFSAQAQKEAS